MSAGEAERETVRAIGLQRATVSIDHRDGGIVLAARRAGTRTRNGIIDARSELSEAAQAGRSVELADAEVPADWLLELLTSPQTHRRGVRIARARIVGDLEWDWQRLEVPLELVDCVIEQRLNLHHGHVAGLTLIRCEIPGLTGVQLNSASNLYFADTSIAGTLDLRDAAITGNLLAFGTTIVGGPDDVDWGGERLALRAGRLHVSGSVFLERGFTTSGAVLFVNARIGGNLSVIGGELRNPGGTALHAGGADIGGSVLLTDGFHAEGRVDLDRARVGGNVALNRARLVAPQRDALSADGINVGGGVFMRDGFTTEGRIRLLNARIAGNWECTGKLSNPDGEDAVWANGIQVEGNVFIRDGARVNGRIRLIHARVGGSLDCSGAAFTGPPDRSSLVAINASVAGDVMLGGAARPKEFAARGEVTFIGARIGGSAGCAGGFFSNPGRVALNFADAEIEGNVWFNDGFEAAGQVRLGGARIGGNLNCGGGFFENTDGVALHGVDLTVEESVFLRPRFVAHGEVRLHRAQVGGTLEGNGGEFNAGPGRAALFAQGARVGAGLGLAEGFVARGPVRLAASTIVGDLDCSGGAFEESFDASGASVTGSFRWRELAAVPTKVNLRRTRVGELDDDEASWPAGGILIAGFGYDRLSDRAPRGPRQRVAWIRRQRDYAPEPYQQLAAVYRANGEVSEATIVAMAQQDDLVKRGDLRAPARAWAWFLGRSIGHGYRPGRAAWALLVLYLVTVGTVLLGARSESFIQVGETAPQPAVTANHCATAYPCLSVPAYALENITPILNLHQAENWQPKSRTPAQWLLRDWLYIATILGYAGTTLLAAALTGLARG